MTNLIWFLGVRDMGYTLLYPKVAIFMGTLMVDQRILEGTLPSTRVQKETQQKASWNVSAPFMIWAYQHWGYWIVYVETQPHMLMLSYPRVN